MTRDYKPSPRKSSSGKASVFFSGLFVGLIIGVGAALGVAMFVKGGDSPFTTDGRQDAPVTGEAAPTAPADATPQDAAERFDFYKILPSNETIVSEQDVQQQTAQPQPAPDAKPANVQYYLQVGAFQTEQEADNMKAQLAFLGLEALVQTAAIPDKGVLHRVRVGPYTQLDQITRVRSTLTQNGFKSDLVKTQ